MAPNAQLPEPVCGIIPPMVTPLENRDTLDTPGLKRLVEHILAGGVHGLFVLGTSGEGPSLSYRLRCELVERVCEQVAARVPVLVGVTDAAFVESVNLADYAADAGAAAVVLSAPFYHPMGQEELLGYTERIVAEMPLPVFLYNMPSHTKLTFGVDILRPLIENPKIVGLKDSSASMIYFHQVHRLARQRPDWSLLIGPEQLLAESVLLGGNGGVCGGANLAPQLYVDLYNAARDQDMARVKRLHERVMEVTETLYKLTDSGGGVIKGLKSALSCLGICRDTMAEPFCRLRERERGLVREHLARLQLPVDASTEANEDAG